MTSGSRRSITTAALCALLVSGQIFVSLPTSAANSSSCSALRAWAAPFRNTAPTLDALAKYDRPHRLAIFNAVSFDARASLWREQLRRFDQRADLSAEQHALIREGRQFVTSALYAREPAATHAFEQFWTRADGAFTTREQRRVWFDLGALVLTASQPRSARAAGQTFCECRTIWDCPGTGCGGGGGCTSWAGCGPAGDKLCIGMCQ